MTNEELAGLWGRATARLREYVGQDVYAMWLASVVPVSSGRGLALEVENEFTKERFETVYLGLVRTALKECGAEESLLEHLTVEVRAGQSVDALPPMALTPDEPTLAVESLPPPTGAERLNPAFTFENFVVGPSNNIAYTQAMLVATTPGVQFNPFFIYGDTGLGKTHLAQAIAHEALAKRPGTSVTYVTTENLMNEYISAIQRNRESHQTSLLKFREKYRQTDLLIIDDVHFLSKTEGLQEEFFNTFNDLQQNGKQIVMTSDRPPKEIANLQERLVSRFVQGLATNVEMPTVETRLAILRYKQASLPNPLPDLILDFIANRVSTSVRALEGALHRATTLRDILAPRPLTIDALRNHLQDLLDQEGAPTVTFEQIQRAVANAYHIPLSDLLGNTRPQAIAFPRQIAMFLCRRLMNSSLKDIAKAFGKTHATIVHAASTIQQRLTAEPELRANIQNILTSLGQRLDL